MNLKKSFILLVSILTLSLSFATTAQAAGKKFSKSLIKLNEGQSKTLTILNSKNYPKVRYYDPNYDNFSYDILSKSKIKITAQKPGISYIYVAKGNRNISCTIVVMPKKNPAIKTRATNKGTMVSYKKMQLTLPDIWTEYGYVTLTENDTISFCSISSYKTGYYGNVFTINWCSAKEWKKRKEYLPNWTYLNRSGNTIYYLSEPSDVQYNPDGAKY